MASDSAMGESSAVYADLADLPKGAVVPGQIYRMGDTGICGTVETNQISVKHVVPGSVADGKIRKGDKIRALQFRSVGGAADEIRKVVAKRMLRLGRDWDWHLYLTVKRKGKGGVTDRELTFDLRVVSPGDNTYHFGPTGFFAMIRPGYLEVSHVVDGSPSAGKLRVGDRIVAVGDEPVGENPFRLFANHIDRAESHALKGKLLLTVRKQLPADAATHDQSRHGARKNSKMPSADVEPSLSFAFDETVTLHLAVLGEYDDSAPLNCPKTDAIMRRTAEGIVSRGTYGRLDTGLIALLATGSATYIEHVGKELHASDWARPDIVLPIDGSKVSWFRAYKTITMCEYYLLSGDAYVLPAIRTYARAIAHGQDAAGLWNHKSANPDVNFGKLHGRLSGYGAINQTSIALWIGLILAEECGVNDPDVHTAIQKTHELYSYWIGRGRLLYGNHGAGEGFFSNNGTSGSVAVGFALLGDLAGASFFSRMSAAATDEILTGHTGPWFNQFWSGLGANIAGPEVLQEHFAALHWLRTVTRTWDGRFLHMDARGCEPDDYGLGSSGSMLLNLAAGRRALRITGRGMDQTLWLDAEAARWVVDAASIDYEAQGVEALVALLGHALPPVRVRAAEMLAIKDVRIDGTIKQCLSNGTRNQRIGSVHAISRLKISSAAADLMQVVTNHTDDLWIRQLALRTLPVLDGTSRYAPEILGLLVAEKDYDIQGRFDQDLGQALVALTESNPYAAGLDRQELYEGVNKLLAHKRQEARSAGMRLLKHMPVEDLPAVASQMIYVMKDQDRSYVSYHSDSHRQMGLDILYGLSIEEALDLTVSTIKENVGRGWRARNRKAFMKTWGSEAKRVIPQIRAVLGEQADEIIEQIENAQTGRQMIPLEQVLSPE